MISKEHRFSGRRDPRIVLKHGKTVRSQSLQIKYLSRQGAKSEYRMAVVVSTKVSKSAPIRNRIRRRVYEAIRELDIKKPIDFVVLVYDKNLADSNYLELKNNLNLLLGKIYQNQ